MQIKAIPEDFIVEEITNRSWGEKGKFWAYLASKKDQTTPQMVKKIASENGLLPKAIGYAGLKDKKAVTTQYVTSPKELKGDNLEFVGFTDEPLRLGDLEGNKFVIKIKDVKEVREVAIPNYFGDQRFSERNVEIGLLLIKKKFKEVIDTLKEEYDFGSKLPVEELKKVPFSILMIYVHSVQSWLWNEVVSEYIKDNFDFVAADYRHGVLRFPQELENIQVPVIGVAQDLGEFESYYNKLLEENELSQADFMNRSIPGLTLEGEERPIKSDIRERRIEKNGSDVTLHLTLGKGMYATVCISGFFT